MDLMNKHDDTFDGFLICSGNSKRQINQFKRLFTADNLQGVEKDKRHLQMRKLSKKGDAYTLDVYVKKELVGHFYVALQSFKLTMNIYEVLNEQSEKLFKEETIYGIKDKNGLDRVNNSIYGGFGAYDPYPTVSSKAAALWYKIATNQFFQNGNKRTAFLSALYLLIGNFYTFDVTDANLMYEISLQAANKKINANYIEKFINSHI